MGNFLCSIIESKRFLTLSFVTRQRMTDRTSSDISGAYKTYEFPLSPHPFNFEVILTLG